jgi:hypothetical protein
MNLPSHISLRVIAINWHRCEVSILALIVKLRSPIIREIFFNVASRAAGGSGFGVIHFKVESIASSNDVRMGCNLAGLNQWISSLVNKATRALNHKSRKYRGGGNGGKQVLKLHDDVLFGL